MGKRSNFPRRERDFYPTPLGPVQLLISFLRRDGVRTFAEPCCGDGALVRHLESFGLVCVHAGDIANDKDALATLNYGGADAIISNIPFTAAIRDALIRHFLRIATAWLLLPSDWASNKGAAPFLCHCSDIVPVGRVRWVPGTKNSSYENFAWYRLDARHSAGPVFHARGSSPASASECLGQSRETHRGVDEMTDKPDRTQTGDRAADTGGARRGGAGIPRAASRSSRRQRRQRGRHRQHRRRQDPRQERVLPHASGVPAGDPDRRSSKSAWRSSTSPSPTRWWRRSPASASRSPITRST